MQGQGQMATRPKKRKSIRAGEGKLGKAKRPAKAGVRARAKAADLLKASELEARQTAIGKKRRSGGPTMEEAPKGKKKIAAPKVAETEADKPLRKPARRRRND